MFGASTFLESIFSANSWVKVWYLALKRCQKQLGSGDLSEKTDSNFDRASSRFILLAINTCFVSSPGFILVNTS